MSRHVALRAVVWVGRGRLGHQYILPTYDEAYFGGGAAGVRAWWRRLGIVVGGMQADLVRLGAVLSEVEWCVEVVSDPCQPVTGGRATT